MLQNFKKHIAENFPYIKGKKILLAISGGVDSMVLHHLFFELNFDISLAHCNFKLREKESDLDEFLVKKLSQKTSNQIFIKSFNTEKHAEKHKKSIQIAARELRYHWFQELVDAHHFDYVATAHHADDNLETFLINFTRGSGLDGFTGIPETNGNIIRPLLPFSRTDIEAYAKANEISWREDASNASLKYIRNKIRHQVIPVLKEINPSLLSSFEHTTQHLKESQEIVQNAIDALSSKVVTENFSNQKKVIKIDVDIIKNLSNPKAYLYQLLKVYNFTAWNDVFDLLNAQSGKQIFSESHRLLKDRGFLLLSEKRKEDENYSKSAIEIKKDVTKMSHPIELSFERSTEIESTSKNTIYLNPKTLKYPLILRGWKHGDYFYPSGMQGKKKLSKYFKDQKFSLLQKEQTWLLCSAEGEIIWIINHRQDRRFIAKPTTKDILKITYNS